MSASAEQFGSALIAESEKRLFEESLPRLQKCLSLLNPEEIWLRPNSETASAGNIVLHLCGNVRQWILSGLGDEKDVRVRAQEFAEKGPLPTAELLDRLERTMGEARRVLTSLDPGSLLASRRVQGFDETGLSILVHVVEHFSYHVGQVTYFVKSRKGIDLQYYAGVDLNQTG